MSDKLLLIVDDRERALFDNFQSECSDIDYKIQRITIGDYAVVNKDSEQILTIFERKTLQDLASSFKDGRWANKKGLLKLREQTRCRIVYILEGKLHPKSGEKFGRIKYEYLESAIFHMMVRDNINVIFSQDAIDTVRKLRRWVVSMGTLIAKCELDIQCDSLKYLSPDTNDDQKEEPNVTSGKEEMTNSDNTPAENPTDDTAVAERPIGSEENLTNNNIHLLNQKVEKREIDIVREMWARIKGLTIVNADKFTRWSISEMLQGQIDIKEVCEVKTTSGRRLNRDLIARIVAPKSNLKLLAQIVSCIPGISSETAVVICNAVDINKASIEDFAGIKIRSRNTGKNQSVGIKRATLLYNCLHWKK